MINIRHLKMLMAHHGLNQRELANKLGWTESKLSKKITNNKNWTVNDVKLFINVFGKEEAIDLFFLYL